jgi:hypothetical protein
MTLRGTARLLVDLMLLLTVATTTPAHAGIASSAVPACRNGLYLIAGTALSHLDTTSGRDLPVATLPRPVNALAYAADQNLFYGVSGHRVVTVDPAGQLTDRGPVPSGTSGAYAGAILGDRWFVRSSGALHVLSVDPHSSHYLHVIATAPVSLTGVLGDWDVDPADGRLYGLVTGGPGPVRLVRIDPGSGAVTVLATPSGLPNHSSYGGVVISAGVLSARYNPDGTLYSLPLAHPDQISARHLGGGSATGHDDAAGCPSAWDFGDAPASYRTTLAQDGPRHLLTTVGELTIANGADADADGAPTSTAANDTDDGLRDPVPIEVASATVTLTVPVRNTTGTAALLAGWLDGDADGSFQPAERALAAVASGAGAVTLHWSLPDFIGATFTVLRLRLYGQVPTDPSPRGAAYGGEVEDHRVQLTSPAPPTHSAAPSPVAPPTHPAVRPPHPPHKLRPSPVPLPSRSSPAAKVAAARATHRAPWHPKRQFSLTWTVVVLLLIPTAACTVRAAGHTLNRNR